MNKTKYTGRTCLYRMNKDQAKELYNSRNKSEKNVGFRQYIINYINSEYGLLWPCSDVELF